MVVVKGRPTILVSFDFGCIEVSVGQNKVAVPLEFAPDVITAMQKLFNDVTGD